MLNGGSSFLKQNDDSYLKYMHSIVKNIKIGVDYETPRLEESEINGEEDILFLKNDLRENQHIFEEIAHSVLGRQRTKEQLCVDSN